MIFRRVILLHHTQKWKYNSKEKIINNNFGSKSSKSKSKKVYNLEEKDYQTDEVKLEAEVGVGEIVDGDC